MSAMTDLTCMSYWWPKLRTVPGINTPKTALIHFQGEPREFFEWYEGATASKAITNLLDELRVAADAFGYPCFIRTGQTSGKHNWDRCCHVPDAASIPQHVHNLFEFSQCVDMFGLPCDVWVVRELLTTTSPFPIPRFKNMPLCQERRYFISDGAVVAHVPYWPAGAISGTLEGDSDPGYLAFCQKGLPDDWEEQLARLNHESLGEIALLTELSKKASNHLPGDWSLDWLLTAQGWYAIDMAEAHKSWACPKSLMGEPDV